ncbi:alpha/beta fold hydrolase [Amycolatopsis lurida]
MEIGGTRLAYRVLGPPSAVSVVLLHGLASSGETWRTFAGELARSGHRVVVPDLRGHGASAHARAYTLADFEGDLEGLLLHLGGDRVDLVGHSLGGRIASMLAGKQPDWVRRLVLEEVRPPRRASTTSWRVRPRPIRLARDLGLVSRLFSFDQSMARPVFRQFRAPDPQWWSALPAITASTLLVYGGSSGYVPFDRLREMVELIPSCRLATIQAGHRVHSTSAREFHAAVLPFLAG